MAYHVTFRELVFVIMSAGRRRALPRFLSPRALGAGGGDHGRRPRIEMYPAPMPPRRRLATVPDADPRPRPPDLRDAVAAALATMDWLTPADDALKALALRQATELEEAIDRAAVLRDLRRDLADDDSALRRLKVLEAMCDVTKTVGWLGPQLQGVLRDLGGAPAARKAMQADKPVGGRLAALRLEAKTD